MHKSLRSNIYRGHLRSLSTDIEDAIALFVNEVLPGKKMLIDASVYADGKIHRPDLLVVDGDNNAIAMIEIKSNMGWCRNATAVINGIRNNDKIFKETKNLTCEFSGDTEDKIICYPDGVKLFLISLTDNNCKSEFHAINKALAKNAGVYHFVLFSGWYDDLQDKDICEFGETLALLK